MTKITLMEFLTLQHFARMQPRGFYSGDSICVHFYDKSMLQVFYKSKKVLVHFADLTLEPVWLCVD